MILGLIVLQLCESCDSLQLFYRCIAKKHVNVISEQGTCYSNPATPGRERPKNRPESFLLAIYKPGHFSSLSNSLQIERNLRDCIYFFSLQICERQQRDISYMQLQLQSSHDMLSKHVTEAELVLFFFCSSFKQFPLICSKNREQFLLRSPAHILYSGLGAFFPPQAPYGFVY